MIIISLFIVMFFVVLECVTNQSFLCDRNWSHTWYSGKSGNFTCGTYYKTGPLAGERIIHGNIGTPWENTVYRKERHCLHCDRSEYYNVDDQKFHLIEKI